MADVGERLRGFAGPEVPVPVPAELRRRGERARRRHMAAAIAATAAAVAVVAVTTSLATGGRGAAPQPGLGTPTPSPTTPAPDPAPARVDRWLQQIPGSVRIDQGLRDGDGRPVTQERGGSAAQEPQLCPGVVAPPPVQQMAGHLALLTIAGDPFPEDRTLDLFTSDRTAQSALTRLRDQRAACATDVEGGFAANGLREDRLGGDSGFVSFAADRGTGAGASYQWWRVVRVGNALLRTDSTAVPDVELPPYRPSFTADVAAQGDALAPVVAGLCVFRLDGCLDRGPEIVPIVTATGVGDLQLGASVEFLRGLPGVSIGRADGGGAPVTQRVDGSDVVVTGSVSDGCLVRVDLPQSVGPPGEPVSTGAFSTRYVFADSVLVATAIEMTTPCGSGVQDPDVVLGPDGLDFPLRLGAPRDRVLASLPKPVEDPEAECVLVEVQDAFPSYGFIRGPRVASVSGPQQGTAPDGPVVATPEGVGEGSSLGQVEWAYPGARQSGGEWVAPVPGRSDRFFAFEVGGDGLVRQLSVRDRLDEPCPRR